MVKLPFFNKKKKQDKKNQAKKQTGQTDIKESKELLAQGMMSVQDVIAPPALEVDFNHVKIGNTYLRTLFVSGYPRFVNANWLSPLINFDHTLDISMYIFPVEGKGVLEDLKRKIGEMEAEIQTDEQRGKIANIDTKVKLEDAKNLQSQLAKGSEKFFQFGLYITIPAKSVEELNTVTHQVQSTLGSLLIITKPASLQMEKAFKTTLPLAKDQMLITRNMDTTSLATTFPFTSSELSANEGIMYGLNNHNNSLIVFDRFTMENANMVVFAKSGAGKSYLIKLEALRSLMFDTEVIAIDPEDEYRKMCEAVGGQYIDFSFSSEAKINPFDLSQVYDEEENELGLKILSLHSLFKIIMGELNPDEEALLDRALVLTYKQKGITPEPATQKNEPPLLEDLYKVLIGMEEPEAKSLASRLEKYVKGSARGIFDHHSNIDLDNPFTVFGIKNLEDELRPIAMFMILDFIWTRVKQDLKKRILIVDEAWYLMRQADSAAFLYAMAKRARKYYLGLTTITQDVTDFLSSDYGKAIVTNSSIQILMKQSSAAIEEIAETFYLSQGEKNLLLAADVGEGLFFAGQNHVAMKVIASPDEHQLITSNPEEVLKKRQSENREPQTDDNENKDESSHSTVSSQQPAVNNSQPTANQQPPNGQASIQKKKDLSQPDPHTPKTQNPSNSSTDNTVTFYQGRGKKEGK